MEARKCYEKDVTLMVDSPALGLRIAFPRKENAAAFIKEGSFKLLNHQYTPMPAKTVTKVAHLSNIPLGVSWTDIFEACSEYFTPIKVNWTKPGGICVNDALVTFEKEQEKNGENTYLCHHK